MHDEIVYPLGEQSFSEIRKSGKVYVDKTKFIPMLRNKFYFFGRPRRFGKSLFLSTLDCFFRGKKELFAGLAVSEFEKEWKEYPIIHIDLNGMNYTEDAESLKTKLISQLRNVEKTYGIDSEISDPSLRLDSLIVRLHEITSMQVVVLIDEYEKPVLDTIDNDLLHSKYKEILRGFYGVLKSLDSFLKLVFITGVTKFGKMNVFSGFNNLKDISLSDEFATLCGITQEEMLEYFHSGIDKIATNESVGFDEAVAFLKKSYDGYHFSRNCPDIYNPFSLLNAMDTGVVDDYWFQTGTPSLLVKALRQSNYKLENLPLSVATSDDLLGLDTQLDDPVPLFYQTGYLTIKGFDKRFKTFILDFPNQEVQNAFFKFLLPSYTSQTRRDSQNLLNKLINSLEEGKPDRFIGLLKSFSAGITYEMAPLPEVERHFHNLIFILCRLLLPYTVRAEEKTSSGRIDMLIETPLYFYIIEFKVNSSADIALQQIKDKKYAAPYLGKDKKIYLIGVNFSTQERCISGAPAIESINP